MQTLRRSSRRERYTLGGFANGEVGTERDTDKGAYTDKTRVWTMQ